MKNIDSRAHTRGESVYLDDIPLITGTLYGIAFVSSVAHASIVSLDVNDASLSPGVIKIFTSKDIPGENQIGGIVPDEPLLAEDIVHYCGMPVAFVVAESEQIGRAALKKIVVSYGELPVTTDPREAQKKGDLIVPPRKFTLGNTEETWKLCDYTFEGSANTNGQEHLYIETQGAYAIPQENNGLKIFSSTQSPTAGQKAASRVLGVPMHQIEVEVTRLGGGFGGKEDQANAYVALCALASYTLKRPVKYSLHRLEDMMMTGKRHPYSSDFKIGLTREYKIIAYEVTFYQNAGAAADLSPAILERTLFHCTNTYFIPNVYALAYSCRTNLPPNTAFRGFGGPQAMFVLESAITYAAEQIGVEADVIQRKNLIKTGDEFPYGQKAVSEAYACWNKAENLYNISSLKNEVEEFNIKNKWLKKGIALMPVCFGISFTNTSMNQARALVHIYTDGSVSVSTGAVEMGQGVNTKMLQVASSVFSISTEKIRLQSTSTSRIANTSPSAASATADLNGRAVQKACEVLLIRLLKVAAQELKVEESNVLIKDGYVYANNIPTEYTWNKIVSIAFLQRVSLSEHAHYATPGIYFDKLTEKGHPFAYHVYGTSITQVTVDCLRGIYWIDLVKIVHDFGTSMNTAVDRGQIEGGIVQGIGWMTMEEIVFDKKGTLKSNTLSTYKVPDIYSVPEEIEITALETTNKNMAIFNSKAVGEPPFMYGIGTYFALRKAIRSFEPLSVAGFDAPMTPEKTLMALYPQAAAAIKEKYEAKPDYLEAD